jgi:hypothetical protein
VRARQLTQRAILGTTMAGLLWAQGVAQSGRPWVDPPEPGETAKPGAAPVPPPAGASPAEPQSPPAQPRRVEAPPDAAAPPAAEPVQRRPSLAAEPDTSPRRSTEPPRAPRPSAAPPATTQKGGTRSDLASVAQELAESYLAYWSAPNVVTLDATPEFYAPHVLFHGRQMTARALFEEKRRFVRRWPVRQYWPRRETMQTRCDPAPPICTVRTAFDFKASNPQTGRRSEGTAFLQLGVSFADREPMIVFEHSRVTSRSANAKNEAFEDDY